jgi:hypothetical protein
MSLDLSWTSRWTWLQTLAPLILSSTVTAAAQTYYVAPAPSGSDTNNCSRPSRACATFQRAVNLCPPQAHCNIVSAPGVYSQKTEVSHFRLVSIWGPQDKNGNCDNRSAVVVDDRINGVGQAGYIFHVADHATLTIQCMTLAAYANGSVGFASRQFAIGDVNYVDFKQFRGGLGVAAIETSKINIFSPGIYGDASRFATAGDLSQVAIGGTIRIGDGLTFEVAFLSALSNSIVLFTPSKMAGGETMSGASYQCNDATIKTNVTLPGGDVPYVGTENCTFNATHLNPEIKAIRSDIDERLSPEIKRLSPEIKAIRSDIDERLNPEIKAIHREIDQKLNPEIKSIRAELDKLNPEIKSIRAEFDKLNPEIGAIYKLLRTLIIAVVALFTAAAMVSAFYVWQQHRRWRQLYQSEKFPITSRGPSAARNRRE